MHRRHRLDAQAVVGVADGDDASVGQAQADAEQVGIDVGQIGDVVGILAVLDALAGFVGVWPYVSVVTMRSLLAMGRWRGWWRVVRLRT